jgi:hypothetical protein
MLRTLWSAKFTWTPTVIHTCSMYLSEQFKAWIQPNETVNTTTDVTLCGRQQWCCLAEPSVSLRNSPLRQIYLAANEGSTGRHKVLRCVPRTAHYGGFRSLENEWLSPQHFPFVPLVLWKTDDTHFSSEECGNKRLGKKTVFLAVFNNYAIKYLQCNGHKIPHILDRHCVAVGVTIGHFYPL